MQCLQPVDPDEQKAKIMRKYDDEYEIASAKFSTEIQQKMVNLLKNVSNKLFLVIRFREI